MSEAKRVPLQTLEFPESLGHATKKEKKGNMGKQLAPSFRFTITLPESNEKTCPEFNYSQLLKSAEKKRRKEQKTGDENATNGLDLFDDDDDEAKLRDMARRFEAKYGTSTMGKKRHKYDDYVDLGAGYDENDSFIDNTDAYDEIVPEEMTTAHGGFYINCGALEFRAADANSVVHNNNNSNNSDDDESSESSEEDTEDVDSPKRIDKRIISSSDDDETEDITGDNLRKRRKIEESGEKKGNHENSKKRKKPQNHQAQDQQQNSQQDLDLLRRKEKNETTDAEGGTASEDQEEKKKSDKPEKSKISEKKFDIKKFEKKSSNSNGYDAKKMDLKRLGGKDSNIDDAIESVVNAARGVEDDSSRDTTDSGKSRVCLYVESDGEEMENKEALLPENLPEDVKEIVNKLKLQAENSKDGKSKFFNSAVNEILFTLEKKLRMLNSPSIRLQTYGHLVRFLPCSKITLLSRAKKLYLKDAEHRVNEPMQKLKALIDNVMPAVMDKYMKECQKVADEKGFEGSPPADPESSDENEDGSSKNTEKSKIPRKRFPWSDEAKKLILEIANARRHYFKILRPRKESMESFVATFMDTNVLTLWPPGCVRLQTLLKYASPVEPVIKKKLKKPKETASANNLVVSANTQVCNSARNDTTTTNNVSAQESEKINVNVCKTHVSLENSTNFASQAKSNDIISADKKQQSSKHKEKHAENNASQAESGTVNNSAVGKISVVPTAQLMAQKPVKSHIEKFNLMDLTNSSLSITPVNDYHKQSAKTSEGKKDVVSITACPEPTSHSKPNEISQTGHHPVYRQDASYSSMSNLKHRFLQENADAKCEKRLDDKDDTMASKGDKKDKRRERTAEVKHKSSSSSSHDAKKRKKDGDRKMMEQQLGPITQDGVPMPQQPTLSKEEQEQMQNEETIAATTFLSQMINDDPSSRGLTDKRKDGFIADDALGNMTQPTDQEKDVQMVIRSLKELQELQGKYSPNNSPIGGAIQKPSKSNAQYVTYQDEYQRLYLKKDDKMRAKDEPQW
ncbi:ubinuclein-1 isoform X2 [Ooceraea biroi]|uniref:Ubinuclein-1 n=1 Tax=Ooceraea biroi TaxID=2015173 RepID=A0A026WG19_OOCBI|nr:ubinuclein-1 isoform X2 [Ooceraea biroi]EZA53979.1 Ubinuclein-1 [Ooceraea biroi]